jgi:putative flippase GtrA
MPVKYIQFITTRIFGTIIDTLALWVLSTWFFISYTGRYIIAPTISFEIAMFSNFLFSYYWIWRKRIVQRNSRTFLHRLGIFNLSALAGFGVKMVFLLLFERIFRWDVVYCNLAALVISGVVNYYLAEYMVFRKPSLRKLIIDEQLIDSGEKD